MIDPLEHVSSSALPLLVLDFDGTVCVGDGPVWAYANAAASFMSVSDGRAMKQQLTDFLDGTPESPRFLDGYAAVASLAEHHVGPAVLEEAFVRSRAAVAAGSVTVSAPVGLDGFLASLEGTALRLLLTNAPLTGVHESLAVLGLEDVIDVVLPNAHKPTGLEQLMPHFLRRRQPHEVLSVGDIWRNDLEPVLAAGGITAFIDRFNHGGGQAHVRAADFPELFPAIAQWANDPASFHHLYPLPIPA
ncbi:MAG: HAD family hydrolase [Acidobacteria bacterium]|nr:HAD family hydrolase [Acidobacteriota bacterium]